jgi:flavodoxin
MKNTLVVFYSRTGNTRRAAERLAKALDADLEEIREARDRAGMAGFLRSGYEAVARQCPPILPPRKAPRDYARVVLGTPVWAGRMASPVRSFLQGHGQDLRRLALFATCGAAGADAAPDESAARAEATPIGSVRPARAAAPPPQPVSHTADTAYDFFDEEITAPRPASEPPQDTTVVLSQPRPEPEPAPEAAFALDDLEPEAPRPASSAGSATTGRFGSDELDFGGEASGESSLFDDFPPAAQPEPEPAAAASAEPAWSTPTPAPEPAAMELGWDEPAPAPEPAWDAPSASEPAAFGFEPARGETPPAFDWEETGESESARAETPEWFAPPPAPGLAATRLIEAAPPSADPLASAPPARGFADFELEPGLGESAAFGSAVSDPDAARDYDVSSSDLGPLLAASPPMPAPAAAPAPRPSEPAARPAASAAPELPERERRELHDALEKLAWEAFGPVAENLVREAVDRIERIAWEVIPQLAESLIKEELRKLKGE